MSKPLTLARLLLISTALVAPAAMAQTDSNTGGTPGGAPTATEEADAQAGNVDVSIPGADIIVTGRRTSNISQAAPQVVNVLSAADIKRTGEGDIAGSWTHSDNSNIVATDTQKHTTYIMAKLHPVNPPEHFAAILGQHFIDTYSHISAAHIWVTVHRWTRMDVEGKPHPHSFFRDGEEKRL